MLCFGEQSIKRGALGSSWEKWVVGEGLMPAKSLCLTCMQVFELQRTRKLRLASKCRME